MSLVEALRAVSGVPDLARVAAELGFASGTEPLPPTLLPVGRAAIVGRSGGFEWIGGEADSVGGARLAKEYLRAGRAAGFLLLDLPSRVLTAAVAAPSAPVLRIALDEPEPVGLARLARCRAEPGEAAAATLLRLAEALLGRGVDYRFFRAFRGTLASIGAALPGRMPPRDRHAFALLQLTRILFLYFVEAKGWLAGRSRFLREEVDRCLGSRRRLHRDLLRPLFFGTLNRPFEERGVPASRFGAVPFLNGGLFEPHPLERRWRVDLPNRVLGAAFD
ncbi:MAG TPA: hypothetical protein VFN96_00245, partial [Gemmatimonadales bacterium]|nr:hypothetical protein [Gemmatimonadales bacterium]